MRILNLITISLIVAIILFLGYIPMDVRSAMYAVSLTIQDVILMILPFIIFSFILDLIIKMRAKASGLLFLFVVAVVISNTTAICLAYFIGNFFLPSVENVVSGSTVKLIPMWRLYLPQLLPTEYAMPLSVVIGVMLLVFFGEKVNSLNTKIYNACDFLLNKVVMPVIPVFIAGLAVKIVSDKMLQPIVDHYSVILLIVLLSSITYSSIWYLALVGKRIGSVLVNIAPSLVTAFTTMSSAVTLPSLLVATRKNTDDSYVASAILPPAVNFHVMGDTFNITITVIAILFTFTGKVLGISDLMIYIFYFIIYRFATVGIPGGGIIILLPFFSEKFGFTPEMLTLITTLYVVFDPFQTVLNIFGNGAFAIFFSKIYRVKEQKPPENG
ncbi:dicarboxylate symporter family protein [Neorickettsia helminthoeca str. Oregon]|uniref:Dicarboxylate symporter family protein n=1 Tax=Neorickettsia helminthoeca str. Oregon TaxID=1286528 RepID=X5HL97_9RICK|nr:cation:dicarboxylase symporter family transporter [Neorickettsia helminthoeca]AHX11145.1 dicarboxylate symporter family protein [Neorickettsia helminthoeca str. Oregon]